MYVVIVDFLIHPDQIQAFLPLMQENARLSLMLEPNCQQFDICYAPDEPAKIFLYEVYGSEADFQHHLKTQHYKDFSAQTAPLVADKQVRKFSKVLRPQ